jgi:hypothetical protein
MERKGGKKNQRNRKRREERERERERNKISVCTGASSVKPREEFRHKSLDATAESHHDVEVATSRRDLVSSQSAHMTILHLFHVCYAIVADEGDGLQIRRLAVNVLNEQAVSDSLRLRIWTNTIHYRSYCCILQLIY